MQDKKAFILYSDLIHTVKKLPKDKAGELFLTILEYVNDQEPEPTDLLVSVTFEPIKQSLKRDLKKWEKRAEKSRENGAKGGRPKNLDKPKKPSGLNNNPVGPGSVKDNVNVNDKVKEYSFKEDYLKNKKLVGAIIKNLGITKQQFNTSFEEFTLINYLEPLYLKEFNDAKTHFNRWLKIHKENNFTSKKGPAGGSQIEEAITRGEDAKDILKTLYDNE